MGNLESNCHYVNDKDLDTYGQRLASVIAGSLYFIAAAYLIASLFRLWTGKGYRKYKTTLTTYYAMLLIGFTISRIQYT